MSLVNFFISDIYLATDTDVPSGGLISKVIVGKGHIVFDVTLGVKAKLSDNIEETKRWFTIKWGYRIFEGKGGYYEFGNILRDSYITTTPDGLLTTLTFPFNKINYRSYFDMIPKDIVYQILGKFRYYDVKKFVDFTKLSDESSFGLLLSKKYSDAYNDMMFVHKDLNPDETRAYSWQNLYLELTGSTPNLINNVRSRALVKKGFPAAYQKYVELGTNPDFDWKKLYTDLSDVRVDSQLHRYLVSGSIPSEVLIFRDNLVDKSLSNELGTLLYLLLHDDNVMVEYKPSDVSSMILKASMDPFFKHHFFDNISPLRINEIYADLNATPPFGIPATGYLGAMISEMVMNKYSSLNPTEFKNYIQSTKPPKLYLTRELAMMLYDMNPDYINVK